MRAAPLAAAAALALLAACGGDDEERLFVGVVDDAARSSPAPFLEELAESGFGALAVSSMWDPGETGPDAAEVETLRAVAAAGEANDTRLFVIVYHRGSATTPLTTEARAAFASYAAAVVREVDGVDDVIVGNEPNLNRFWLPQFGPAGEIVSARDYLALLARTYDAVKAARHEVRVWGGATAPRGADRPGAARATTSPTAFIRALGDALRRSGRREPVMDGFVHHPYPESARVPVDLPHPNVTTIGLADYGKLVALLEAALAGTAHAGGALPILYGEFGVETRVPPAKAALYRGEEPVATVSEQEQAAAYRRALELVACQPRVVGMLVFHLRDEPALGGWQSGVRYPDGTAKQSLAPVRDAVRAATAGELGACTAAAHLGAHGPRFAPFVDRRALRP